MMIVNIFFKKIILEMFWLLAVESTPYVTEIIKLDCNAKIRGNEKMCKH